MIKKEFFFKPNYRSAFRDWIQTITSNPEVIILVAKEGEKAVGIVIGIITANGPLILPDKIGYIPMFVVSAQFRRKKIGDQLWTTMQNWFAHNGIKEVQLYTLITNEESRPFWDHYGFNTVLERRSKQIKP